MTSPVNNEEAIINLVKAKPFLWNIKDPEYKNISLKTEEFENIGRNFNLTGDEIRRKWRSLRSGFRRELLARSNKKPKPKTKQWKHFNKLLFLRESENIRDTLSDNEFEDNQQQQHQQPNNTICVNQADVSAETDFSDLMQINSPISNLVESATACENGDIRLNIITNSTSNDQHNKDKNLQDVNENTQFKIIPSNINTTLQPSQIYFVKTANGVSDMSPLLFIKKSDQTTHTTTTQQLNEEHYHHQPDHHQQHQQQNVKQQTTTITTTPTTNLNNRSNDLILNSFKNNVQVKNKKRKDDSDDELDADDYFGRMVAQLIKEFDEEQRKSCRLAVLQLITEWSGKKNHQDK